MTCRLSLTARANAERMIGFLSHEVRNPQSAITMSIESILAEAHQHPVLFRQDHIRLFEIIRSSSEFVTMLLDGMIELWNDLVELFVSLIRLLKSQLRLILERKNIRDLPPFCFELDSQMF